VLFIDTIYEGISWLLKFPEVLKKSLHVTIVDEGTVRNHGNI